MAPFNGKTIIKITLIRPACMQLQLGQARTCLSRFRIRIRFLLIVLLHRIDQVSIDRIDCELSDRSDKNKHDSSIGRIQVF